MFDRSNPIYVKTYTTFGETRYCLGNGPTCPERDVCSRLGGWFLALRSFESALGTARGISDNVIVCDPIALS
jgi:hypothetical protein